MYKYIIGFFICLLLWGVIGSYASSNPGVDCAIPIGPLCLAWQKNSLGQIQEVFNEMNAKYSTPPKQMPLVTQETCDDLVPNNIIIKETNIATTPFTANWGLNATSTRLLDWCNKGKEVGENINHYYCNAHIKNKIYVVDDKGDILNDTIEEYEIDLVADLNLKIISYDCQRLM